MVPRLGRETGRKKVREGGCGALKIGLCWRQAVNLGLSQQGSPAAEIGQGALGDRSGRGRGTWPGPPGDPG